MRAVRAAVLAFVLAATAACVADDAGGAPGQCTLAQVASYMLHRQQSLVFVPASIQGTPVLALLDTGAERSVVTAGIVTRLGLLSDPRHGSLVSGVGGAGIGQNDALVEHYVFAGYDPGVGHYAVINVPIDTGTALPFGGIIGGDILSDFDLDLDVPHDRLTVYRVHNCRGRFLPWSEPYSAVPMATTWNSGRLVVPVTVDGVQLQAMLDTGAASSVIDSSAAQRLGVTAATLGTEPSARGFGAAGVDFSRTLHRFGVLQVGDEQFPHPRLAVLDRTLREADMLLGEDFLRQRHVWISYRTGQLFVAAAAK
jgi:predicted aspartyl protease